MWIPLHLLNFQWNFPMSLELHFCYSQKHAKTSKAPQRKKLSISQRPNVVALQHCRNKFCRQNIKSQTTVLGIVTLTHIGGVLNASTFQLKREKKSQRKVIRPICITTSIQYKSWINKLTIYRNNFKIHLTYILNICNIYIYIRASRKWRNSLIANHRAFGSVLINFILFSNIKFLCVFNYFLALAIQPFKVPSKCDAR